MSGVYGRQVLDPVCRSREAKPELKNGFIACDIPEMQNKELTGARNTEH